jgi:predicted nucleotidyltransferase
MVESALLNEITHRVANELHPERIILFGSHAWGVPANDSDLDLLVIVGEKTEPGYRIARRAYRALRGLRVPVDFVIRSRAEIEASRDVPASLEYEALNKGRVLYG